MDEDNYDWLAAFILVIMVLFMIVIAIIGGA